MKQICTSLFCICVLLTSCVKSDVVLKTSPHIKSFRFENHKAIPGIERVTFTIDTINCVIYNEDSVAYNHSLTKLLPKITYTGSPKEVKINNVNWNSQDSIDFSLPVGMYILSQNKKNEANYTITINQHRVNPNEIIWKTPYTIDSDASTFKVTTTSKALYAFVISPKGTSTQYNVYSNDGNNWNAITTFESEHNITSIATFQDQIYASNQEGNALLKFDQNQWTQVSDFSGGKVTHLLGSINHALWITGKDDTDNPILLSYNGQQLQQNTECSLPEQFAIEGSTPLQTPYGLYLIGGKQGGLAQNCIISSDNGYYWTNILNQTGKYSISPCYNTICTYYDHNIYVIGGYNNYDEVITDSYISDNNGFSWNKTSEYQQLPATFIFQEGACAAAFNNNLYVFNKKSDNSNSLEVWEGRIRRVDFIRK